MSSRIEETLSVIGKINGHKTTFGDGYDFFVIVIDPRRIFGQGIIDENPEMPKVVREAIVARILELRDEHKVEVVGVTMDSRLECHYTKNWTTRLMCSLIHHGIFVESDDQKFSPFNDLYSRLANLTNDEVMRMVQN